MYYIYYLPNYVHLDGHIGKIGCTKNYPIRPQAQSNVYELLETHEDGWLAGDRELELQREYGLPIDTVHYMIASLESIRRKTGVPRSNETKSKISNTLSGRTVPDEVRVKMSLGNKGKVTWNKGKSAPKKQCPKCGDMISYNQLTRHINKKKSCA